MKIIILAAGKGERLMPLTRNMPKSLLDMGNGYSLIEEQLARIRDSRVVDEAVVVVGYLAEQIEAKLASYKPEGLMIRTIFNPFYAVSNNLLTLWLAKHEMLDDFLITNGDNLFSPEVFSDFVGSNRSEGIFLAMNKKHAFDEDDMKILLENGKVARVSKQIPAKQADGESPGLAMVRGSKPCQVFVGHLENLARRNDHRNAFWLEVFNSMYSRGRVVEPWQFDAEGKWQEVDFHVDLKKAQELLSISVNGRYPAKGAAK